MQEFLLSRDIELFVIIAETVSNFDPMSVICQIKIPAKLSCHSFVRTDSPDKTVYVENQFSETTD